ncbi:TIGR01906 family membrane protein [Lacticaseibacillus yichunensis]|uniref:TIGR01906 family membrane protein n=1 Tax=Lacticaseibacillus yichunensis TaxID=2486015 RepID=A0ABW4CME3_9LACO|nr:TIGR01906 family membrane protein [Lacticaseibacillus yichunensis]
MTRLWPWKLGSWLAVISGAVVLTLLLSFPLYAFFMQVEDLPAIAAMPAGQLFRNYAILMLYLCVPGVSPLRLPDFPVSASGAQHFADVKNLFLLALVIFILTSPVLVHFLRRLSQRHERWRLVRGAQVGAVVPIVLLGLMAVNFDTVFITFHKLLFRNDDWLFDPATDPIINVLPEDFFAACFGLALLLFEAAMIWAIWRGRQDARRN